MQNKIIDQIFKYKHFNEKKLFDYGFQTEDGIYVYHTNLMEALFQLSIFIYHDNSIKTKLIEQELKEEYTLHMVDGALGSFVGLVREEYTNKLKEISKLCFDLDVFPSVRAKEIISYIKDTYHDELEFLWENSIDTAIWRRKDNQKWYGLITNLPKRKLEMDSDGMVTIINVRIRAEELDGMLDNEIYFKAYHMNKKHWVSIRVDEKVPFDLLKKKIDDSYALTK